MEPDHFILQAIKTHADSLPEKVQEACRARAKAEHMDLQAILDMLTAECMRTWAEPPEVTARFQKQGNVARREVWDGKALAGGRD